MMRSRKKFKGSRTLPDGSIAVSASSRLPRLVVPTASADSFGADTPFSSVHRPVAPDTVNTPAISETQPSCANIEPMNNLSDDPAAQVDPGLSADGNFSNLVAATRKTLTIVHYEGELVY